MSSRTTTINSALLTALIIVTANGSPCGITTRSWIPRTNIQTAIASSATSIVMNIMLSPPRRVRSNRRGALPRAGVGPGRSFVVK
jgi:uncharacterized membrane protein YfcA